MKTAFLIIGLLLSAGAFAHGTGSSVWTRVDGGPSTQCANGTPYAFFVHTGRPDRLLVYFAGGGACWSAKTCDPHRHGYNTTVKPGSQPAMMGHDVSHGIFDLSNSHNPVRDYTIVYVAYCTGDVFLGDRTVTFNNPSLSANGITVHYAGHADAMAALHWVYAHVTAPTTVLVAGESAGAVASAAYAGQVADHYPHARVVQLEVSLGAFGLRPLPGVWGAGETASTRHRFAGKDTSEVTENDFTTAAAERANIVPAQYNTVEDEVQLHFLRLFNPTVTAVEPELALSLAKLRAAVPHLRTYTGPGRVHTILALREFYTLTVSGVPFRDWLADLLEGRSVPDVACAGCLRGGEAHHSKTVKGGTGG